MPPGKPSALIKPTLNTQFYIDYDWWENKQDLQIYLLSHLTTELRDRLSDSPEGRLVDYINPDTGEVTQMDEIGMALQEAARDPDFINPQTSLVDSIFRVFLTNDNTPLTPTQLAERIDRDANLILKTLGGIRIYKGIRPYNP